MNINKKLDLNKSASTEHSDCGILIINLAPLGRYFTLNDHLYGQGQLAKYLGKKIYSSCESSF